MSIRHKRDRIRHRGRERVNRPKTFANEESAKKWADAQGLKDYELVNLRTEESSTKKFKVVSK